MNEQRKKILQMLAEGKISADEADRLLAALESRGVEDANAAGDNASRMKSKKPSFLHVSVHGGHSKHENVDIKIPIMLLKAGVKLGSLMPENTRGKFHSHLSDHGFDIDLNDLDGKKLDSLIQALAENPIEIVADNEVVNIRCA